MSFVVLMWFITCWFLGNIDCNTCVLLVWDIWFSVEKKIVIYV